MEYVKPIEGDRIVSAEATRCAELLREHGVDTSMWGLGSSKKLRQLATELIQRECRLVTIEREEGKNTLARTFSAVEADVFYLPDDGTVMRLHEEMQVFRDGRSRERPHVRASITEKMRQDENPDTGILRALEEELGIIADRNQLDVVGASSVETQSQSYPGLLSVIQTYQFAIYLTDEQFNPSGYTEEQADKTTYFSWEILSGELETRRQ